MARGSQNTGLAEAPRKHWRKQAMSITDRRPVFDTAQVTFLSEIVDL